MKLINLFIITLLWSCISLAEVCTYSINSENVQVEWRAFKTPKKVGVGGTFKSLGLKNQYQGNSLKEALESVKFSIDASTVDSKNEVRDAKISTQFFALMSGGAKIDGFIQNYSKKTITLSLTMNGTTKEVPLTVEVQKDSFNASGYIDILDFSMSKSLQAINKACFELHEGKTWSDVEVKLLAKYSKSCK